MHAQSLSRVQLCATLWTVAHQAPLSMEFSRQEYWSGLSFPSPGSGMYMSSSILALESFFKKQESGVCLGLVFFFLPIYFIWLHRVLTAMHGMACGILVPQPGIKPASPALEGRFLTTGPPGKSLEGSNFLPFVSAVAQGFLFTISSASSSL